MLTSPIESAIIIKVPQVDQVVERYRRDLDPSEKWGVPAHVTLLYPFLPPSEIDTDVLVRLKSVIGVHKAFEVKFLRTKWFGEEVLWLAPEPDLSFRRLTEDLITIFPETPPYGGSILNPTPHLTVADGASVHAMREVESLVAAELPIHASCTTVSVMVGSPQPKSWRTIVEIPLHTT